MDVFNSTNSSNFFFESEEESIYEPLIIFYTFILFLISPFYVHVSRSNRERDKASSVYQVISYFYKSIIYQYVILLIIIIAAIPIRILWPFYPVVFIPAVLYSIVFIIGLLSTQVNYHLISLLAIQRFFIYFHPWTEKYLQLSKRKFRFLIIFEYIFAIIGLCNNKKLISLYLYVWQNLMLLSSCILYIPIGLSIRKFSHLASFQGNQPQRYILWQLVTVVLVKFIYTISYFFINLSSTEIEIDPDGFFGETLPNMKTTDALAFPLVIQLSYLGCNRHNLKTFLKSLNLKQLLLKSFRLNGNNQVNDRNQSIYMSSSSALAIP